MPDSGEAPNEPETPAVENALPTEDAELTQDSAPPAEESAPLAEEGAPPAEESAPPAEDTAPPAEDTAPPPEEGEPPPEEGAPPAEEDTPPAGDTAPPAEESAPLAEEGAPPAEDTAPPAEEGASLAEESAPLAEEGAPPAEESAPPAEEGAPPAEESAPPAEESAPPVEEGAPPADEGAPPVEGGAPPTQEGAPPADEGVPPAEEGAPPAGEGAPPAEEGAPPAEEGAPPEEVAVPADQTAPPAEQGEPSGEDAAPAEEAAPTQDAAPADEAAPAAEQGEPAAEDEAPSGDAAPAEDAVPATEEGAPPTEVSAGVVKEAEGEVETLKPEDAPPDADQNVQKPPLEVDNSQPPTVEKSPGSPPLVKDIDAPAVATEDKTEISAQTKTNEVLQPEPTATVKLILMPSGQTVTKTLPLHVALSTIIDILAGELKMPQHVLELLFNGKVVELSYRLDDYGIEANGTVAFEVNSKEPNSYPIPEYVQRAPVSGMADVITVRIQMEDSSRDVVVEIERTETRKPFLGGYRHKRTGVVFHHAITQTNPKTRVVTNVERFSRDTQTWEGRHKVQMTFNTTSTQMTKPGVYVSNVTDKLIVPGRYECADDYHKRILKKVIVLQRYLRAWLAKRYVDSLREEKNKRMEYEKDEEIKKRKAKEDRIRKDFERRMNPKTKEDFDLLYSALEKWRQEELARINTNLTGAERKAALYLLLEQETELIAAIDRHQLDANAENKEKGIHRLLSKAAASKKWRNGEGKLLEMDTPYTLRGKELLDIYNSLNMRYLTQDERLDVLLTLKHTVKEHDCKLTQEIVELIDREADLLMRGVKEDNLMGLRKRITTLFLQYTKTPVFNPEMAHLLKVPQDPSVLRQDIHYCVSCGRYLQSTEFSLGIKSTGIGRCRQCLRKDNLARTREDQSTYKYLLQELRQNEEEYRDNGRIAFLIEEADVRYLVDNIWEGMSILSSWNDLADLQLVRWNHAGEWSPWNTILLTKDEAEAHRKLIDLEKAYGNMLVHRVKQKHVLAKNYFHKLKNMAEKMLYRELELENVRYTSK